MFKHTFSLFALSFLLTIQLAAQTVQKPGTATISGRVVLKGEPAAGASVGLQPQQTSPGGAPAFPDRSKYSRIKTDAEGRFSFSSLNAGQYRIVALAPGFVSADDSQLTGGKLVNLADGENLENVELRLKPGAVITGRVTDPTGNPVVEKTVQLSKMDARGNFTRFNVGFQSLTTDDRGVYRVHSLPAGKYKVSVGYSPEDGFRPEMSMLYYLKTFHPDVIDESRRRSSNSATVRKQPTLTSKLPKRRRPSTSQAESLKLQPASQSREFGLATARQRRMAEFPAG